MVYYFSDELYHHGVKGMKWGVRRFQNEDGTLTDEGKARYGNKQDYSKPNEKGIGDASIVRKGAKLDIRTVGGKLRKDLLDKQIKAVKKQGGNTEKLEAARKAQSAANDNMKAYMDHTSTGKLIAQQALLGVVGSANYRAARARGAGRMRSFIESNAGFLPVATILALQGNKKAYGKRLVLSAIEDDTDYIL